MSPSLHAGKADAFTFRCASHLSSLQHGSLHRRGDRAADKTVKPMVVAAFRTHFPLIDTPSPAFGSNSVFAGEVVSQHAMLVWLISKQRQTAAIPHRNAQTRVDKRFPVVCVIQDVANGALAMHVWNAPVISDAVARPPFVFGEWLAGSSHKAAMTRQHNSRMRGLTTELVDHIGGRPPVGVNQAALNPQHGTIVPFPFLH